MTAFQEKRAAQARRRWRRNPEKGRAHSKRWRERHPGAAAASSRKSRTGWTPEEYKAVNAEQKGLCAICGLPPDAIGLRADHNHQTGQKRALLCKECNVGLGCFYDNPWVLQRAVDYLKRYKEAA